MTMGDTCCVSWKRFGTGIGVWLFLFIFTLEVATLAVHAAEPDCSVANEGVYLRDTEDCSKFYRCVSRRPVARYCALPLVFSLKLHVCVWRFDPVNNDCEKPDPPQENRVMPTTTTPVATTTTTTTTKRPTNKPIKTKKPTKKPTKTKKPTELPTTLLPTEVPTTLLPTEVPTTLLSTEVPTTLLSTEVVTSTAANTSTSRPADGSQPTFETGFMFEDPVPDRPIGIPDVPSPDLPIIDVPSGQKDPIRTDCSDGFTGTYPHPRGCALFYDCQLFYTFLPRYFTQHMDECPYPQLYSTVTHQCEHYNDVDCGNRNLPISPCEYRKNMCGAPHCQPCSSRWASCTNREDGIHSHQNKLWSSYYCVCKDQRVVGPMRLCPPILQVRQIFHPLRKSCVDVVEVPVDKNGIMPDCTGQADGKYPDILERESYYYTCKEGQFEDFLQCPTGYRFDRDVAECVDMNADNRFEI